MIDLKTETPLSFAQASELLPPSRNGRKVHTSYLVRAITRGSNGVQLEAFRIGRRWITTVEAMQRWLEAQTPPISEATPRREVEVPRHVAGARRRAAEAADRELQRLGL